MAEPPGAARRDGDGSVTPERWQRISDIVADALAIDDLRARAEFVRDAVADDTAMLKEIDALLVHAETPAPTLTPEALAHGIRMTLGEAALATAVLLQADVTANDADDQALLAHFKIFGPPTIAFFGSDGVERENFRLVGFVPADNFREHVAAAFTPG